MSKTLRVTFTMDFDVGIEDGEVFGQEEKITTASLLASAVADSSDEELVEHMTFSFID